MRAGLTASIVGHAAILGFGFVAFPSAEPFNPEKIEALPVELVTLAEATDLLTGDKQSEILPEEKPQPKPEVQAEAPTPEPAELPAAKPVEATPPPPAARPEPPPEPEPEPIPEPEQVAALPPAPLPPVRVEKVEPVPEAEPDPKPVEARVPRARPKPPKPVEEARPEPEAQPPKPEEQDRLRELAETPASAEEFNSQDIAALLDKQDPAGGGDPLPADAPQTLGSVDGSAEAAMTQSEIAALKARLYRCWSPPIGVREAGNLVVEVRINLLPDGSLASAPQSVGIQGVSNPLAQAAVDSAIRAVNQCAPFGDILRPETYAEWRQIDFLFDPRGMMGG